MDSVSLFIGAWNMYTRRFRPTLVLALTIIALFFISTLTWHRDSSQRIGNMIEWSASTVKQVVGSRGGLMDTAAQKHRSETMANSKMGQSPVVDKGKSVDVASHKASLTASNRKNSAEGGPMSDRGDSYDAYREIFSTSKKGGKYYPINMRGARAYNGNLIPHPTKPDIWIFAATHADKWSVSALTCIVKRAGGELRCSKPPTAIRTSPGVKGQCNNRKAVLFNKILGPRDIRLLWGPEIPFVVYGSQSRWACLGLWVQDARALLEPYKGVKSTTLTPFKTATELRRPAGFDYTRARIDKNYFLFWDYRNTMYVHFDIWPRRSFAQLLPDGSVGKDLAPLNARADRKCLFEKMPDINKIRDATYKEFIHQATNSLALTLCNRSDTSCHSTENNTFIMHIFHRQKINENHPIYQPYIMLLQQKPPFAIHAISTKAFWIHGRTAFTASTGAIKYLIKPEAIPKNQTEMFYVNSIAWKSEKQKYQGYLDDPLWLNFGKEDTTSGAIDVLAKDLVQDLGLCR